MSLCLECANLILSFNKKGWTLFKSVICVVISNVVCLKTFVPDLISNYDLVFKMFVVLFSLTYNTCKLLQFLEFMGVFCVQANIEVISGAIFEQCYACESYRGQHG
jgi:hypothetical protein